MKRDNQKMIQIDSPRDFGTRFNQLYFSCILSKRIKNEVLIENSVI